MIVTSIATQGRDDLYLQYVTKYRVLFSLDCATFTASTDKFGTEIVSYHTVKQSMVEHSSDCSACRDDAI